MATITATAMTGSGARTVTEVTLNASSDTFTYSSGARQILVLRNPTASPISPTIDGDGGTTVSVQGLGSVDVSGGYAVGSIAAGAVVAIPLDTISSYLQGTIAITSGSGLVGVLLSYG